VAKFYWVFDGFVLEPEQNQDDRGPGNGLQQLPIREELRAHLDRRQERAPGPAPVTSDLPTRPRSR
jgi:hypothetical protein